MKINRPEFSFAMKLVTFSIAIVPFAAVACQRAHRHADAERSSARTSAAPSDLTFLNTMTAHHQRAIVMWQAAATRAAHPELRDFAIKAVAEQRREILLMQMWRDRWFAGTSSAAANQLSDADTHMPVTGTIPGNGPEFDKAFLAMMVPHHQRAAEMARTAAANAELPEIRELAQIIVNQQEEEVQAMQRWQRTWFPANARPAKPRE